MVCCCCSSNGGRRAVLCGAMAPATIGSGATATARCMAAMVLLWLSLLLTRFKPCSPPPSLPPSPPGQFCCWRQNEYRLVSSSGMAALLCCRSRWDYYYYPEALTVCVANRVDRTAVATAAVLRSCTPIYHLYVCLPVSICDESRSSPFSCCYHVLSLVLMLLLQQHSPVSAKRVNCPR